MAAELRAKFNELVAPTIARGLGLNEPAPSPSRRFACFVDESRYALIAGPQEGKDAERALALGLTTCGDKKLVLVLPAEDVYPTLHRAAWLRPEACPEIWTHDSITASLQPVPGREEALGAFESALKGAESPEMELRRSATPTHLGRSWSDSLSDIVEWATKHPLLDGSHRRGQRSWQCMGNRVLSIATAESGLKIKAGIHRPEGRDDSPRTWVIAKGGPMPASEEVQAAVLSGLEERLTAGSQMQRFDEHWLQAVIRRSPSIVGIEHPALRELPAWRPASGASAEGAKWSRGYLDLVGLDGHGDVRLVETKLSSNSDELLVIQGLDYYLWALAYRAGLMNWLSAPKRAELEIHYVVGDREDKSVHVSRYAEAQAKALHPDVRWRFQEIRGWRHDPGEAGETVARLLPPGELPWPSG